MINKRQYLYLMITLFPSINSISAELSLPQDPLQNREFVPPNVMLMMDNSGSMRYNTSGGTSSPTKMDEAKQVAISVIKDNLDINFCLAKFNTSEGGQIVNTCAQPAAIPASDPGQGSSIVTNINALNPTTWTPLAETYYEVIRYFAGKSSAYNSGVSYTSPIQYRCQKNFTIVLTDGEATQETSYPRLTDMNDVLSISSANYDQVDNDGTGNSNNNYKYLDDFAKYAWDADLRPSGTDSVGQSFNDPAFGGGGDPGRQNMYTYTVGFAIDDPMLNDAASYGNGIYNIADNVADLTNTFNSVLKDISSKSQAVSSVAASSDFLLSGTDLNVYQSRYYARNWTSELISWKLNSSTFKLDSTPTWTAPIPLAAEQWKQRVIYSGYNGGSKFRWSSFSSVDRNAWFVDGINLIPYLRGKPADAQRRVRDSLLGDVINSSPVYVSPPKKGLHRSFTTEIVNAYDSFANDLENRKSMIFVGSNDGMLHGYNAANGTELIGFYPSKVLPNLKKLTKPDYEHQFYVDGTPTVSAVYDTTSSSWRTLLVGGLRRGGQGIYALDISNPNHFTNANAESIVRWEFGDDIDADFGYSYSQPQIMRLNDGKFYVVVGNGYNNTEADGNASTTGNAVLYLLNVEDGSVKKKLSTGVGLAQDPTGRGIGNGLSTVSGYDKDNDGKTDFVYGGDLFGNVWKFDLTDVDPTKWGAPAKFFTACGADTCLSGATNNNHQPITSEIEVVETEYGKTMLFFGTGKLLEVDDTKIAKVPKQSFYGLIDDTTKPSITSRSQLLEQRILYSGNYNGQYTRDVRVTSDNKIKTHSGWYMDLHNPVYDVSDTLLKKVNAEVSPTSYSTEGEQVIARARYSKGAITFFTKSHLATLDKCSNGGIRSFTTELSALSGSRFSTVRSDTNKDGKIDDSDSIDSGKKNTLGEKEYLVISGAVEGNGSERRYVSVEGADGKITDQLIDVLEGTIKTVKTGFRASWREITND
jgi:type IV pilus assembly protein PilY1